MEPDLGALADDRSPFWCPKKLSFSSLQPKSGESLPGKGEASVLILLRKSPGLQKECWEVLLTVRSDSVTRHKGEVAFPGGKRDPGDRNPVETALREAEEEVGLPNSFVEIKGILFPFRTRYDLILYPVIGILTEEGHQSYGPICNPEVECAFWLPLERFLSNRNHNVRSAVIHGRQFSTHTFLDEVPPDGEAVVTWGITSFVLVMVAMLIFERRPDFEFPLTRYRDNDQGFRDSDSYETVALGVMKNALKYFDVKSAL